MNKYDIALWKDVYKHNVIVSVVMTITGLAIGSCMAITKMIGLW